MNNDIFWEEIKYLLKVNDGTRHISEERHFRILYRRFYLGETLREVASKENIHHERVRQLEAVALRRLRHPVRIQALR